MDAWEAYAEQEYWRNAVRDWAKLEGKSPQMTDDLAQRYELPAGQAFRWQFGLELGLRIAAWLVETWWYFTSR